MENDGRDGDDQGSGWLEVRKKHRSSSKFALQKSSGSPSHKPPNFSPRSQAPHSNDSGNRHGRQQWPPPSKNLDFASSPTASDESITREITIDRNKECLDGCVAEPKSGSFHTEAVTSQHVVKVPEEMLLAENTNAAPRIAGLVDPSLPPECCNNSSCLAKCADAGSDQIQNSPRTDLSPLCVLSNTSVKFGNFDQFPTQVLPSDVYKDSNEASKDVRSLCSEGNELAGAGQNSSPGKLKGHEEDAKRSGDELEAECELKDEIGSGQTTHANCPPIVHGDGTPKEHKSKLEGNYEQPASALHAGVSTVLADNVSFSNTNNCDEVPGTSSAVASAGNQIGLREHAMAAPDFGGEMAESKERFRQRLWCFLFENLNRAVDELYLLCELECDMEQINESILVLEEATSDFQELKSRAEHFDNTKRSPPNVPKDGMSMTVKSDHRRRHALSWEVRRMTTSPHRQEILSSSLEAFKRIQLELAQKHAIIKAEDLAVFNSFLEVSGSSSFMSAPSSTDEGIGIGMKMESQVTALESSGKKNDGERQSMDISKPRRFPPQGTPSISGKSKKGALEPVIEFEKHTSKKDRCLVENKYDGLKSTDIIKKKTSHVEKEEKQNIAPWKSMDAWKEKRNWEDILKSPIRSSRVSHSPGVGRKVTERARVLHDKLMSPEKKRRSALDMKREAEEKHARAMRIRSQLESERAQRLQRTSEKLNRVNELQAVRSSKLREVMNARHQRGESRHEAHLAQVAKRAGDESIKVSEVRFITSLNEENKKFMLRQKLHDSEVRRAEKLQVIKIKQKEDTAREEAVLERRKVLEAEKLQRLAQIQRRKEEAVVKREEERKASSAAREARAVEQQRRKEIRAKAQQEEAELLAQKLAEKLRESEQRRKYYLEQIRERASMDFRDQPSPFQRRFPSKDSQSRSISANSCEETRVPANASAGECTAKSVNAAPQHALKRKIKKIRQKLMALKHEFVESPIGSESSGIAYRAMLGAAKVKVSRWLQDLQRLRQARKEGAASIGLVVSDMTKFLEGKDLELHASRQAGLLDFIASALPASHTSRPGACQVTDYLLQLLRVLLSLPANRTYFLVQNLLPPIIPMLSASLENYIKVAASNSGSSNLLSVKASTDNLESVAEVLDGFLWTVTVIVGHVHLDDRQLQMQGGLIELIVAYQIIHRLRDLFALYDRPQVEGSPLPSPILSGLNLLAVLTSRPGTFSTIDWESCKCKTLKGILVQEYEYIDSQDMGLGNQSMTFDHSGDIKLPYIIRDLPKSDECSCSEMIGENKLPVQQQLNVPGDKRLVDEAKGDFSDIPACLDNPESVPGRQAAVLGRKSEENSGPVLSQKGGNSTLGSCHEERKVTGVCTVVNDNPGKNCEINSKQPVLLVLSAMAETGLVSLPSLLTAVLLQSNNRSSSEQASAILPSNFEEVATGVLKVLNNMASLDITLLQCMLARSDLKMEFFHLISFLLGHCTNKWKGTNDQVGLLLLETLLLLGYFSLFHTGNQAVLRWGKSPTILHKVCDLPFVFFSDPELMPILAAALLAACYGCDQNKSVVQQELSTEMVLSLLKSCRSSVLSQSDSITLNNYSMSNHPSDNNHISLETRNSQGEISVRSSRRSARPLLTKGASGIIKFSRMKAQKDGRGTRTCDTVPALEASSTFMLHRKFPTSFLDKAEEFFSSET